MDLSKYKALYLQETRGHLSGVEKGLIELEKDPEAAAVVDEIFRHFHSIKGMSASMGYEPIKTLAHAGEDLLDMIRGKRLAPSPSIMAALFDSCDALKNLVARVDADLPLDVDITPCLVKLKLSAEAKAEEKPAEAHIPPALEPPQVELKLSNVMKVEGKVFDRLLAEVGSLFMSLSAFKSLSQSSRSIEFKDSVHLLGKSINEMHSNILSARMIPVEDLIEGLPRVIRDLTKKNGKPVELKTEGTGISLDRSILEDLGGPLLHIIRNCVDHGIESPEEREKAGKPSSGTITIRAYARKDQVVIEAADDGRGIDVGKIKRKAVEKGLSPERVSSMTDKEAVMLVCLPGLSGADTVTETSGRGVGMDVVKGAIEGLGGTLSIESTPGRGTKIIMGLPRTTSIIKTLLVTVSGEYFLVPLSRIEKVIEVRSIDAAGGTIPHAGWEVPILPLGPVIGIGGMGAEAPHETCTIVIVEKSGQEKPEGALAKGYIGLKVDDFGAEMEAYVRPLTPPISKLWGVSGITVLSDGRPVFLLDIGQLSAKAASLL